MTKIGSEETAIFSKSAQSSYEEDPLDLFGLNKSKMKKGWKLLGYFIITLCYFSLSVLIYMICIKVSGGNLLAILYSSLPLIAFSILMIAIKIESNLAKKDLED